MKKPLNPISLFGRISGKIIALALIVEFIVRIILMAITPESLGLTFGQWIGSFLLGAVNDLCFVVIALAFLLIYCVTLGEGKYRRPMGYIIFGLLAAAFIYVCCFNTVFNEYGSVVPLIARIIFGFWAFSFGLRLFMPRVRDGWSRFWLWALLGVYVLVIYFNGCAEFFFWDEFNVRYNFIAVDYLIYTNEVIGNIMESYAIIPLAICVMIASVVTTWLLFRNEVKQMARLLSRGWRLKALIIWAVAAALSAWLITFNTRFQQTENTYYNELQANGPYKFFDAFRKNHLEFTQFYVTLPDDEADRIIHDLYGSTGENLRHIAPDSLTARWSSDSLPNIVLITMESMSADFMKRYGSSRDITPNLDSLAQQSLTFDNLIATGNRTVRGLEA
ncbi:MAG: sulfatase-like hydrolase/transferase, partial [Muribaculaceae bacterium]|nr:sulfatase-like hydrolase/transferase [Muribaculaceae bacterium]